jgi:hypothetical protein
VLREFCGERSAAQGATIHDDRRSLDRAFNGRKLKVATFQTNLDYGCLTPDVINPAAPMNPANEGHHCCLHPTTLYRVRTAGKTIVAAQQDHDARN